MKTTASLGGGDAWSSASNAAIVFSNLAENALQNGANRFTLAASHADGIVTIIARLRQA